MFYIGIDIGGTFTDLVIMDEQGNLTINKAETTPHDLTEGLLNAITQAAADRGLTRGGLLSQTAYLAHATTAATNALIQRRGVKTGLITTKGFRDTIFIQRMMGVAAGLSIEETRHFSRRTVPAHLVTRQMVKEVTERVDYKGEVVVPLNRDEARGAVKDLLQSGAEAIAICLLWSFQNPAHEQEVKRIAAEEAPELFVCASSDLAPVMKEYERTASTVINSYLGPVTARYLGNLEGRLAEEGFKGTLSIMNSLGGVFLASDAARRAVEMISSGPAGGILGAMSLGKALGYDNIIASDMGGTSFDVGLVVGGQPIISAVSEIARYHVSVPMVEDISIGAGGGSIARVTNGLLTVGPDSAGSRPGPVCYGKGGTEPTVTDADVVLGYVDPDRFLGGRIKLDRAAAEAAIAERIARPMGIDVMTAAAGIRTIIDNKMCDLMRSMTLERGHDPSDFIILAYGGAGPCHCCAYSRDLKARAIVVPFTAPAHSAYGAVGSDLHHTFGLSDSLKTPPYFGRASDHINLDRVNASLGKLKAMGMDALKRDNISEEDSYFTFRVAMRYRRQTHEVEVPLPGERLQPADVDAAVDEFGRIYENKYGKGTGFREAGIEWSRFKVDAAGRIPKPKLKRHAPGGSDPGKAFLERRNIFSADSRTYLDTPVDDGNLIKPGNIIEGPAIVQHTGTTVVISPEYRAKVDVYLNLILEQSR